MHAKHHSGPIKRQEELVPYSREHHNSLLLIWKIRAGVKKEIEVNRIVRYLLECHKEHLLQHFLEEECYLFPLLDAEHPLRLRAEKDHADLRSRINSIENEIVTPFGLLTFADGLEAHVRFEERELFGFLQNHVGKELLCEATQSKIQHIEKSWDDGFWQ